MSRRGFLRGAGAAAVVAGLPVGITACTAQNGQSQNQGNAPLDRLTFNMIGLAERFDTTRMALQYGSSMLLALEPLLLLDPVTGKVGPHLCTLEVADPVTYRLKVRKGVKFWDGSPMTVEDVKFSMDIQHDPDNAALYAWVFKQARSIKITDDWEITVKLDSPQVNFHAGLTQIGVVKRDYWRQHRKNIGTPDVLNVGTGPYKVTHFDPGKSLDFVRNDSYWGTEPKIQNLTLTYIDDPNTAFAAIKSGQLTGNFSIPRQQLKQYQDMSDMKVYSAPGADYTALALDRRISPYDDIHVRRAIAHCIDKEGIISSVYQGAAVPAKTMIAPPLLKKVMSDGEVSALTERLNIPYDIDKAQAEMAKSAHPDGFSETVLTNPGEPALKDVALILKDSFEKIGINLAIKQVEQHEYNHKIWFDTPHKQGLTLANMGYFAWSPFSQLLEFMTPAGNPPRGYQDIASILTSRHSKELTSLWHKMNQITDVSEPTERKEAAAIATRLLEINHDLAAYPGICFRNELLAMDSAYTYDGFSGAWLLGYWWGQLGLASG